MAFFSLRLLPLVSAFCLAFLFDCACSSEPPFACDASNPSTSSYAFCKQSLSIEVRVQDLVSRLSVEEKIAQLVNKAPAIPRLGIPSYSWWSEALHGISGAGGGVNFGGPIHSATSFPQVIHSAASFNPNLWYRIGQAIGIEARGFYNNGQAGGLTFWAPNINIYRDPRWGRGQETPGEDPTLVGKYAANFVRGFQGDPLEGAKSDSQPLKASACCKHFTAYDLDNWKGTTRYVFDAKVTQQDLADTYQPPFRSCVEQGRASGIMCSYNSVNGVPPCADFNLLSKTARQDWGFYGYVVSDCDAVSIIYGAHHYAKSPEDAAAFVLKAGLDVNCGSFLQEYTKSALGQQKLSQYDIDRALRNLFSIRMRLGLFNGNPKNQPFGDIGANQVCSQEHQNLAFEAARDGIVLLKNSARLLPLSKTSPGSVAVIGPNADDVTALLGDYAGEPCKRISALQALRNYVKDIRYVPGCEQVSCSPVGISEPVAAAKAVDHVILIMGLDITQEKEELDRVDLVLPGYQNSLITTVAKAAKNPVILVVVSGGPVDITFAKNHPKIGAILWAGYPGEAGGLAIADVIFGNHNPGGRLPVTWYPQSFTQVPMTDMRMRAAPGYPGRTYRFYNGRAVFSFGYGQSYSSHSYEFVSVSRKQLFLNQSSAIQAKRVSNSAAIYDTALLGADMCRNLEFSAVVRVQNLGEMGGKHSVLLFVRGAESKPGAPIKELVGFENVNLESGGSTEVEFLVKPCDHLSRSEEDGARVMEGGSHHLLVGDSQYQVTVMG
ncbi:probable beta-D-xylosidase 7 [Aristolochia californica]|uniref:probable beta-D-xylosidase 7 n=1 Tax=Aristolochia californica TaxID=171875 RepID=UPI0035DCC63B